MLVRFRQDVLDLKPRVVVILAGINDIAGNTGPMTLEQTEGNIASMAELASGERDSRGAVLGAAGIRLSLVAGTDARAQSCGSERVDEAIRGRKGLCVRGLLLGDEG